MTCQLCPPPTQPGALYSEECEGDRLAQAERITAALTWRCRIATAARGYEVFLVEDDPLQLMLWGGVYKTGNIKEWAKERVEGILAECEELWLEFCEDEELVGAVGEAARDALGKLEGLGWKI